MQQQESVIRRGSDSLLATHQVLRRTYMLLSATLVVSALTAGYAMVSNAQPMGLLAIVGMFGLLFLTRALSNSVWGIAAVFAFTGFMGYMLGPMLNMVVGGYSNGTQIIATSLGATGMIFFALSAYVLTTRKDFSYMGGFLTVVSMVIMGCIIAGLFFHAPAFQLLISAAIVLFASGMILFQTSAIINGGERNFIMATVSLYVSLFNLFINLLQIFMALSGQRD